MPFYAIDMNKSASEFLLLNLSVWVYRIVTVSSCSMCGIPLMNAVWDLKRDVRCTRNITTDNPRGESYQIKTFSVASEEFHSSISNYFPSRI